MISISILVFHYPEGGFELRVPQLTVEAGERVAVIGPSGSGKTTLLHLIAGVSCPGQGSVVTDGVEVTELDDSRRRAARLASTRRSRASPPG